jgi:hypothetical protein
MVSKFDGFETETSDIALFDADAKISFCAVKEKPFFKKSFKKIGLSFFESLFSSY